MSIIEAMLQVVRGSSVTAALAILLLWMVQEQRRRNREATRRRERLMREAEARENAWVCENCRHPQIAHEAGTRKCLFGPSTFVWEGRR